MGDNSINELLGISESRDILIKDNILHRGKHNKQERTGKKLDSYDKDSFIGGLRSLPLLYRLGLTNYTFNNDWTHRHNLKNKRRSITASYMWSDRSNNPKRYDFGLIPPFHYHIINHPSQFDEIMSQTDTLVMAANQSTEDAQNSISMRDFVDCDIERKVALVPENFHFKGESHGRNLSDYGDFYPVKYEDLLELYMENQGSQLSNYNSKNIVIRELEEEFFRSEKHTIENIETLFDITQIPAQFPTRKHIQNISKPYTVERYKLIKTLFYPWIDCDSFSAFTKTLLKSIYIFKLQRWH